jgi:hypothetical protein
LFGAQQVLFERQTWPVGQLGVLATPQFTVKLQLFVAWPHVWPLQAVRSLSGAHPQTLLMQAPPSHVWQSIGLPQLSVVIWQRPTHQLACCWHSHTFCALQVVPVGQIVMHTCMAPQLSGPVPQCEVHQLTSDTQLSPPSVDTTASEGASPLAPSLALSPPHASSVSDRLASPPPSSPTETSPPPLVASDDSSDASFWGFPGSMPRMAPHAIGADATATASAASAKRS